MEEQKSQWAPGDAFKIPGQRIPSWRTSYAVQKGVADNILIKTWGGIGDQICAEPTLRYALSHFKNVKVTLASHIPEAFSHLKFQDVYDLSKENPIEQFNLLYQFMAHNVVHCVDFPSLCALRCTLPIESKTVTLKPPDPHPDSAVARAVKEAGHRFVVEHAGKHWQSKTFPADWYDRANKGIDYPIILIGKENGPGQGTVDIDASKCIDLREKTTISESIWLLQQAPVVFCNDSSPLHMAVSGKAWIGFIATAKHPDYLYHWRRNLSGNVEWAWRMQNLGLGGYWDIMDYCPNTEKEKTIDKVDPKILASWLPEPETIGAFVKEKMDDYFRTV